MTLEEYKENLKHLNEKFNKDKRDLDTQYALSNKRFLKGDIIKNHNYTILIDEYKLGRDFNGIPYMVYYGLELKKDLTPKKNGSRGSIHDEEDDSIELLTPKA